MWLFTKYGAYSAVCARMGNGSHAQPVDPNRMMVRARNPQHLQNLIDVYEDLTGVEIVESQSTDYCARMFVAKDVWVTIVADIVTDVDYDNFKNEVSAAGLTDPAYTGMLHGVWGVMNRYQGDTGNGGLYNRREPEVEPSLFDRFIPSIFKRGNKRRQFSGDSVADAMQDWHDEQDQDNTDRLHLTSEPDLDEIVLVVREAGSADGEALVIVWWFETDFVCDVDEAYSSAVQHVGDNLITGNPMFETMSWQIARDMFASAHVYDKYMYTVETIES